MTGEVVDLGEYRFTRDRSIIERSGECRHRRQTMVDRGQYVQCDDCGAMLSPYWVLKEILEQIGRARASLDRRRQALDEQEARTIRLRAAQTMEKEWRSRRMVPACPHCHRGLLPDDMINPATISKDLERQRRIAAPPARHSPVAPVERIDRRERLGKTERTPNDPSD